MTTQTTRTVTEAQVSWTADHEQYLQGHGISFSSFDECSTGIGDTLSEAFDDTLEMLAQNDIRLSDEQEAALLADLTSQVKDPSMLDMDIVTAECPEKGEHSLCECGHDHGMKFVGGKRDVVRDNRCFADGCTCGDFTMADTESLDCAVCAGEWHYYVSIDVKLSDSTELNSLEAL